MSQKVLKVLSIFWNLFIGIGAFFGGVSMLIKPDGSILQMQDMLPMFEVLPFSDVLFQNYIFPGISLIIVNGLTQIITFILFMKKSKIASRCTIGCGVILMLWICFQFYAFPMNPLSISYFIFGLIEAICGILLYRKEKKA